MIKTSVIITVYNRSHLLRKALLSLKNQSVTPDELILSDDGSEEDIAADIQDIVKDFQFPVKFVKQENKGFRLAKCRNNGVRNSSGEFLVFIDQDIIQTNNLLEEYIINRKEKRFLTSERIVLSEEQSEKITEQKIADNYYDDIIEKTQKERVAKQYKKDKTYYRLQKLGFNNKPDLRGFYHAINRNDYIEVNGYDEKYIGWGGEDDDIRRRLNKIGVMGYNPLRIGYPIHLYHSPFQVDKERINEEYHLTRKKEINNGFYRPEFGLDNPFDEDTFEVIELN
jgi:glycosyltransferase involved in cell wall biosynthesis